MDDMPTVVSTVALGERFRSMLFYYGLMIVEN